MVTPIISPSQDIVLGIYFLTIMPTEVKEGQRVPFFKDIAEAIFAHTLGKIHLHTPIEVRFEKGAYTMLVNDEKGVPEAFPASNRIVTTLGRLKFNDITEKGMPFYNCHLGKKGCARVIDDSFDYKGKSATIDILDNLKDLGFEQSTISGVSFGITDLRIPQEKYSIIEATQQKVNRVEKAFDAGAITDRERYNQLLDLWTHCREEVTKSLLKELKK